MNPPKFRFFIAVTAGFLLQNALSFIFPQVVPPFLLMAVVFYALYQGAFFGLVMGC